MSHNIIRPPQRVRVSIGGVVIELPDDIRHTDNPIEQLAFGIFQELRSINQRMHEAEAMICSQYTDPREENPIGFTPPQELLEPLGRMFARVDEVRAAIEKAAAGFNAKAPD